MRDLILLGAGGYARETMRVIQKTQQYRIIRLYDETIPDHVPTEIHSIPVIKSLDTYLTLPVDKRPVLLSAVGSPALRKKWAELYARVFEFVSIIDTGADVGPHISIGVGSIITAGCILTIDIQIGSHVNVNLDCTIGHDVTIRDYCELSPGCHISGNVILKEGATLGTGAVIIPRRTVGAWSIIGAGAVVTSDIPDKVLAVGIPAKVVKELS